MSNYRNFNSNAFYEEFDIVHQYGYVTHHYLRVFSNHETHLTEEQLEERKNMLELGFAPAVGIYESFEDFLKVARDW